MTKIFAILKQEGKIDVQHIHHYRQPGDEPERIALLSLGRGRYSSGTTTSGYRFTGQAVAMRRCGDGNCGDAVYFHGDHLGSVSLATDEQGNLLAQARYTHYSQVRWDGDTGYADEVPSHGSTAGWVGLMDYNAHFYSPRLGEIASPSSYFMLY